VANISVAESTGAFTRDQVEILSTRKGEPEWLRERRLKAHDLFASLPMPDTRGEEWRYTDIGSMLRLEEIGIAEDAAPVTGVGDLPAGLRALVEDAGSSSAQLMQVDASVVHRDLPAELEAQGVIFTSMEQAVRDHGDLVREQLGSAITDEDGKFAALNAALWTGGPSSTFPRT
jgi:Fe-S cluster assembly scaffold protein SufB